MVSTTLAGALLRNTSSVSWRSELAMFFSSCSILLLASLALRVLLRLWECRAPGRTRGWSGWRRPSARPRLELELHAGESSGWRRRGAARLPARRRGSTARPRAAASDPAWLSVRSVRASVTISCSTLDFALGFGVGQLRRVLRIRRQRDRLRAGSRGRSQALPEFLGEERHGGMQQPQRGFEGRQHVAPAARRARFR